MAQEPGIQLCMTFDHFLNSKFKIQNAKLRINKNFELIILRVKAPTDFLNQWSTISGGFQSKH